MRLIRLAECPSVPWKNGAGATRELWKMVDAEGQMLVRCSIAEISGDQPFSQFPGIDRVIMQLDGPSMELVIDGEQNRLGIERPLPFRGEAVVTCKLHGEGKAHDLNLMCRRDSYAAATAVLSVRGGESFPVCRSGKHTAIVALTPCELEAPVVAKLQRWDMLVCDEIKLVKTTAAARFAVLTATPR